MSRINMRTGITTEQVNDAAAAKDEYYSALEVREFDGIDDSAIETAIQYLNNAAEILADAFGNDHLATRRAADASIRAQVALEKNDKRDIKASKRLARLAARFDMYKSWFVMIDGVPVSVCDVRTEDGEVVYEGKRFPFIPVYMPKDD